jgi:hypothetical protein
MTSRSQFVLFVALFVSPAVRCMDAASFQVIVDVSGAPNAQPYVGPVKALFEEWYPKINDHLFGKGVALPFKEVRVIFERTIELENGSGKKVVPAYTKDNVVHVNFAYVGIMPDDYRGMLIHELAHVSQNYTGLSKSSERWLGEGIADYVRHKYFERDLLPKLLWDSDGTLQNSDLDRATLEKQGYLNGYTIAAPSYAGWS